MHAGSVLNEELEMVAYCFEGREARLSQQITLFHCQKTGRVIMEAVFDGVARPISVCRMKEIFHQIFWKLRCGLVELGAVQNTMYPPPEVMARFHKFDQQFPGERLRTKLELATAFALVELN
jgi:hypothetical protein